MRGKITIDQQAPNFVASSAAKIEIDLDGDDRLILVARFIERFRQLSLLAARSGSTGAASLKEEIFQEMSSEEQARAQELAEGFLKQVSVRELVNTGH